jgi:hypothetical protein
MLTRLLTILPLLLCPLLMLACMWAMRNRETPQRQARDRPQDLPTAARVAQLERELVELPAASPRPAQQRRPGRRRGPTPGEVHPTAHGCGRVDRPAMIPTLLWPYGRTGA